MAVNLSAVSPRQSQPPGDAFRQSRGLGVPELPTAAGEAKEETHKAIRWLLQPSRRVPPCGQGPATRRLRAPLPGWVWGPQGPRTQGALVCEPGRACGAALSAALCNNQGVVLSQPGGQATAWGVLASGWGFSSPPPSGVSEPQMVFLVAPREARIPASAKGTSG